MNSPNGSTLCQCGSITGKPCGRHMAADDVVVVDYCPPSIPARFGVPLYESRYKETKRLNVHVACTVDLDMPNDNRIELVEES
jgi:hypothetical protein